MSTTRVGQRLRRQVLSDAGGRCGYCRASEEITGAPLEIEHIVPEALDGPTDRANLWAVCRYCNLLKSDRVAAPDPATSATAPLFNPRAQRWTDQFAWIEGGRRVHGTTPTGRATVEALALNRALLVRAWILDRRGLASASGTRRSAVTLPHRSARGLNSGTKCSVRGIVRGDIRSFVAIASETGIRQVDE